MMILDLEKDDFGKNMMILHILDLPFVSLF